MRSLENVYLCTRIMNYCWVGCGGIQSEWSVSATPTHVGAELHTFDGGMWNMLIFEKIIIIFGCKFHILL